VAVTFGIAGVHGRRTHDLARVASAVATLRPTTDERVARAEIASFFESGWVGWDVKTEAESACGADREARPTLCVERLARLVAAHEERERRAFARYTVLAWCSLVPGLALVLLGVLSLRRRA
jgi:hypothetical protein